MSDATELIQIIKEAATGAVESAKPVNVYYGTVLSASPLQINVEQKMTLGAGQLVLSRAVKDYKTSMTINWETEESSSGDDPMHSHDVSGKKTVTIHNGLAAGETVILLRQQGGQKYFVVDRVG